VSIGIDAAVVADHQVAIRGESIRENFKVAPTLAGLAKLSERLAPYAGALVVAEPTAGTWFPLSAAVTAAGCRIGFVANRDSARLRQAITGKTKTDLVDAEMLAGCAQVLEVHDAPVVPMGQIGLRRAMHRRHLGVVAAHGAECRLWALAAWAFPDVWRACGGHRVAQPVLGRWPHLGALSRAHLGSITELVAAHSADAEPGRRAERIRNGARGWLAFWRDRLDVDALGWEVAELADDIEIADATVARATRHAMTLWQAHWPDDVLCSVPGIGPVCAAATRAWWGDASHLPSAKTAASFIGLAPSNWQSGLSTHRRGPSPRRAHRSCAWPTTRPPTWPVATTPTSPPTTGASWSSVATTTSRPTARWPASWRVGHGRYWTRVGPMSGGTSTASPSTRPPPRPSQPPSPCPTTSAGAPRATPGRDA